MIDCIVCNLELGMAEHTIFLPDGTQTTVPSHELPLYVLAFAQSYENYQVKLVGHPVYAEGFKERIKEEEQKQYHRNILNIEILGGKNNE